MRATNQDASLDGTRLFAVADGFGAEHRARTASAVALDVLAPYDGELSGQGSVEALGEAVDAAGHAVRALGDAGTTLTAMLWTGIRFGVVHVGDSRLYQLRGGELILVTHDHTYPQALVDEGKLTPDEAASHPERARLVRALHGDAGPDAEASSEPDLHLRDARADDRYLLCTDGLHAVVEPGRLRELLAAGANAHDTVDALIAAAHEAGAPDNVTCLVVDVVAEVSTDT